MILHDAANGHPPPLAPLVAELTAYVRRAAVAGTPAHEVEDGIRPRVRGVGRQAHGLFFHLQGTGDIGEVVELPDGS